MLLVGTSGRCGGAEISLALLARDLNRQGLEVRVLCPEAGLPRRVSSGLANWHFALRCFEPARRMRLGRFLELIEAGGSNLLRMDETMRVFRPHMVHANGTDALLTCVPSAWMRRTPIVWHVRDFAPSGRLAAWCGRAATWVIAVSQAVHTHLIRNGVDPNRITVVPNGVDSESLAEGRSAHLHNTLCMRLGWPSGSFIYVNVGQYVPWKRQDVFLDAAARVARECDRARFLVVGGLPRDGDTCWRTHLEKRIVSQNLTGRVRLLSWQDAMEKVLGGANALVHTASREPFGRVLIEAMALGVPVIAAAAAGTAEIVDDEALGLTFPPEHLDALVAHMRLVRDHPERGAAMALRARTRVQERFTAERTAEAVRRIYARLSPCLDGHVPSRAGCAMRSRFEESRFRTSSVVRRACSR